MGPKSIVGFYKSQEMDMVIGTTARLTWSWAGGAVPLEVRKKGIRLPRLRGSQDPPEGMGCLSSLGVGSNIHERTLTQRGSAFCEETGGHIGPQTQDRGTSKSRRHTGQSRPWPWPQTARKAGLLERPASKGPSQ